MALYFQVTLGPIIASPHQIKEVRRGNISFPENNPCKNKSDDRENSDTKNIPTPKSL